MTQPTFTVSKAENGKWMIQKSWDRKGWIGTPCKIGDDYHTARAAERTARLLAGREAQVKVIRS